MSDIVELLRKPMTDDPDIMKSWDGLRKYLLDGHRGSYARDVFESVLCLADEEREEAADRIATLTRERDDAIQRAEEARAKGLEEAAAYHDDLAARHDACQYESDHHDRMSRSHRRFAEDIRALAAKQEGET